MALLDKKWICPAPFTGLTINPQGNIVLCCASASPIAHMNNIESLESFYNSSQMQYYRDTFYNNKEQEVLKNECYSCQIKNKYGLPNNRMATLRGTYQYENINEDYVAPHKTIRYLEFTTSNICNQSCAMCGPQFSSKWVSIERANKNSIRNTDYPASNYVMPNNNIEQIIEVLPGLEHLIIKGGEPFADDNNLRILEHLNKVNPTCAVKIISNCSNITDSMLEVLKERAKMRKPVKIIASVDGINDLYYWIRSTDFNTTLDTLEKIYNATKVSININITISLYNIYNLIEIFEFFYDKPYIHLVVAADAVQWPRYCSPSMLPGIEIVQIKSNILTRIAGQTNYGDMFHGMNTKWWNVNNLKSYKVIDKGIYDEYYPKVSQWIDKMNKIRGTNLYDIVPQLKPFIRNSY
jgi:radical SAM protein with 4Fe4S-binding SPASM domain